LPARSCARLMGSNACRCSSAPPPRTIASTLLKRNAFQNWVADQYVAPCLQSCLPACLPRLPAWPACLQTSLISLTSLTFVPSCLPASCTTHIRPRHADSCMATSTKAVYQGLAEFDPRLRSQKQSRWRGEEDNSIDDEDDPRDFKCKCQSSWDVEDVHEAGGGCQGEENCYCLYKISSHTASCNDTYNALPDIWTDSRSVWLNGQPGLIGLPVCVSPLFP
jgi:hypothetical protein